MRYLAALVLLAFCFANANAQQFNHQYIKYKRSGLDSRQTAAIVDHNHDGKPDVVSSFESGFDMLRYTNDGKTYTPQVIADSLPGYDFMQRTDINKDGHTDVLVAFKNNSGFWAIGLWLNNGKDAFSKIQVGSIGDPTYKIEVADFDNDGDKDILLDPKGYRNYFWYYENDGNLNFAQSYVNFDGAPAVLFGVDDLNNDGLIDVLAAAFNFKTNQYDLVAVEQDTTHKDRWLPNAFDAVNRVEGGITGDFDGQNRADLFFAPQTVSNTDAYFYTHSGNFSFKKSNAITVPKYLVAQQTIDFNTDGKLDFFYTDLDGIHVMQNRGNGQFNKLKTLSAEQGTLVGYTDMNADGLPDLVHLNSYGLDIRYQQTNGNFNPFWRSGWWGFENAFVADWNGDGTQDLITTGNTEFFVQLQSIDQKILPATKQTPKNITADYNPYSSAAMVDYDKDGDQDFLAIYERNLYWLENQNGVLTAKQQTTNQSVYGRIVHADVDGDANLDFFCIYNNAVTWLEWNGTKFNEISAGTNSVQYDVLDIDGDNDLDVLYLGYDISTGSNLINVATNNGGSFSSSTLLNLKGLVSSKISSNETHLKLFDWDNDNDLDAAFNIYDANQVALFQNLGNGQFQLDTVISNIYQPDDLAIADFNLDGFNDLVVLTQGYGRLHVLTNQKGKGFKDSLVAEKSSFGHQLTLADFDQDGDMDVFTVSSPSDNLSYFENLTINCKRSYSNQAISICDGDSVQVGNKFYRTAATVVDSSMSSSGCDSIAIYEIDVNTDPKLQVTGTADFIYLANAGQVDSIKWFLDGKEVNAAKNDTLFPTQTGNYYAEYGVNGCLFTSNTLYYTLVGLPKTEMQIAVYPNPTTGVVNVLFDGEELLEYRLLNLQGKVLQSASLTTNSLNFSEVEGGVYVLEIVGENGLKRTQLVICN